MICGRRVVHASPDQLHAAAVTGIREDKALLCFKPVDGLAKRFHSQRGLFRIANIGVVEQKVRNVARGVGLRIEEGKHRAVRRYVDDEEIVGFGLLEFCERGRDVGFACVLILQREI